MIDATIACRHCKCRCRKSSRSGQRRHSRKDCESREVPWRRSRGRSGFASEVGHVRWASPPEARLCTAMTGDQVVNTAIGGFGVHVGQVALQMPLMWSQSLKLAVVVLPGWTMVPLASLMYCSICVIMENNRQSQKNQACSLSCASRSHGITTSRKNCRHSPGKLQTK